MCHESWWRERRARRDEESREIWRDFEEVWPPDPAALRDVPPQEVRLDTEEQEAVTVESR